MLSKESFLIAIKGIQQQRTFNEEMYTLLRKYDTQTNGFDCGCIILHEQEKCRRILYASQRREAHGAATAAQIRRIGL